MAQENKYGKITTERGSIPEDEPVFLLRAQDVAALPTLGDYLENCRAAGASQAHMDGISSAIHRFHDWQESHTAKVPGPARS
jgi:hypothetical protein